MTPVKIGHGNRVIAERILALVTIEGTAARRTVQEMKQKGILFDCCQGRGARTLVVTDSPTRMGFTSSLTDEALTRRIKRAMEGDTVTEDDDEDTVEGEEVDAADD